MATAEELLALSDEKIDVLTVDLNTRVISIPTSVGVLGVESDDDVKQLHFSIPRYYCDNDLSEFDFRINFEDARHSGDFYPVPDLAVSDSDDTLSFSWLVDRSAFAYPGEVTFSICMRKYDDAGMIVKELNTTTATMPVLEGLETEKALMENYPSAFDAVLFRLYAVEAATGAGQNGYYTIAKVEEYSYGVKLTIIDKDGVTVGTVTNGVDGYSPVKGVDYWTNEEQESIKSHVMQTMKTYVDNWSPSYKTITLAANRWNGNTQTVSIADVKTNSVVFIAPDPSDINYERYNEKAVRCIAQGNGSLTFTCESRPDIDLSVNVAVYISLDTIGGMDNFIVSDDGNGNVTIL